MRTKGTIESGIADGIFESAVLQQSVGRTGIPDDVAGAAVFLASDLSNFMTGQILNIDGGLVAH